MNEAKSSADAGISTDRVSGGGSTAGTLPPRSASAAAKSACVNQNPATMTTAPSAKVRNISGTIRRS